MDWVNLIGWLGTLAFLVGLGFYVRVRSAQEEREEND
jgi:hypothetical protein